MADSSEASTTLPARVDGKFAPGVSGNPAGRPKGSKNDNRNLQRYIEFAFREHVTVEKMKRVVNKVIEMAEGGSIPAAKLLFDKLISNASDNDDGGDTGRTVVFRIENATFAAKSAEQLPAPATDVEVIDVTPQSSGLQVTPKQETHV